MQVATLLLTATCWLSVQPSDRPLSKSLPSLELQSQTGSWECFESSASTLMGTGAVI